MLGTAHSGPVPIHNHVTTLSASNGLWPKSYSGDSNGRKRGRTRRQLVRPFCGRGNSESATASCCPRFASGEGVEMLARLLLHTRGLHYRSFAPVMIANARLKLPCSARMDPRPRIGIRPKTPQYQGLKTRRRATRIRYLMVIASWLGKMLFTI